MGRFFRDPAFWGFCFMGWFIWLWWLSSGVRQFPEILIFPNSDKVIHAGFFFGGSGLFSAFLYRRSPLPGCETCAWRKRIILAVFVVALVGALDEFHQSFVPGRSGNDPFDLMADVTGALIGALVFWKLHWILKDPEPETKPLT